MESPQVQSAWNLQTAKARFSELVDLAVAGKPQVILRRGRPAAVVISIEEFDKLRPRESFISFLLNSPLRGSELVIPPRELDERRELPFQDEDA